MQPQPRPSHHNLGSVHVCEALGCVRRKILSKRPDRTKMRPPRTARTCTISPGTTIDGFSREEKGRGTARGKRRGKAVACATSIRNRAASATSCVRNVLTSVLFFPALSQAAAHPRAHRSTSSYFSAAMERSRIQFTLQLGEVGAYGTYPSSSPTQPHPEALHDRTVRLIRRPICIITSDSRIPACGEDRRGGPPSERERAGQPAEFSPDIPDSGGRQTALGEDYR